MTFRIFLKYITFIILFSTTFVDFSNGEEKSLGTIVVTSESDEGKHQTGDVVKEDLSSFYKEIKRKDFEGKFEGISEVLEKEAGIQIMQRSGFGSYSTASIRGSANKQVLVYIDGILLNDANGGIVDLSTISLSDVEAIDVYKGFTPIQFGKAYTGGTINIRTRRPKKGLSMHVIGGHGSYNTKNISLFANYKPNLFDLLFNIDYLSSDNDYPYLNENAPMNPDDDVWEKRNNNHFQQSNLLSKFGFDLTKKIRLDILNQTFYKKNGFPNRLNSSIAVSSLETWRNLSSIKIAGSNMGKLNINTYRKFDFIYIDEKFYDPNNDIGTGQKINKYITYSYGYDQFFEWPTKYNIFISTMGFKFEKFELKDLMKKRKHPDSYRRTYSLAIEDTVILFNEKFLIKPLFRYSYILDRRDTGVDALNNVVPNRKISRHTYSPQIGLKYNPAKWLHFKTNFARYVREPTFFELYGDRGTFVGQVDLKDEVGYNFDAGFEIRYKKKKKLFRHFSFDAAYFRSDLEDVIVIVYDSAGVGRAQNISKALIQGVELNFQLASLQYLNISANYTWNDALNLSPLEQDNGKKLPGVFEHTLFLKTEFMYKWIKVFYEFSFGSQMYHDTPNTLPAKDKFEHNMGLVLNYEGLAFTFEVKNIGNSLYEDYFRYRTPGTAYYFSIKYGFEKNENKKNKKKDNKPDNK